MNLQPFAEQNIQAEKNDAIGYEAGAHLGGHDPYPVTNLADVPEQKKVAEADPAEFQTQQLLGMLRGTVTAPKPQPYFRVNKEHFENAVHADNAGAHTPIGQMYQQGHSFYRLPDGHYAVRKDLYDAIGPEQPTPEPPQSIGQDLKNVPANVGAGIQKGIGGVAGLLGTAIQYPRKTTHLDLSYPAVGPDGKMHTVEPKIGGYDPSAKTGIETSTGQALQGGGEYLIGGANLTEKELPVQGMIGKQAVGMGELGVDQAMGMLAGPAGFTASFAARSAGTMYANARAQGDTRERATEKAITAGMVAAITPKIMHLLPPQVGEDVATQVAKAYLGTGGMVAAQSTLDQLTLKYGTGERIDIGEIFPEAAAQGVVGVVFHGAGTAMQQHREAAANPPQSIPEPRHAEAPLVRPDTMQTPAAAEGDYAPQPRKDIPAAGEFDLQPTIALRKLAQSQGIDPRLPREQLIAALRKPAGAPPPPPPGVIPLPETTPDARRASSPSQTTQRPPEPANVQGRSNGEAEKTPPKAKVKPDALDVGDKATINKLPVEVIERDGQRVLKDGDDLPETPIDYLDHVPLDKGSLVKATSKDVKDTFTSTQTADAPQSLMERIAGAETAAKERLKTRFAGAEARAQAASQGRRRGGGAADPLFDPDTLKDLVIVGGAKLAKIGVRAAQLGKQVFHLTTDAGRKVYAQWKPLMQADVPGITTEALNKTWLQIRKLGRMTEEEHANWWIDQLGTPAEKSEKVLTRVRRLTGQVNTSKAVSELDALRGSMKAQARGADAGYKAGVRDVNGLKSELARIVKENLPPSAQRQFLDDVAKVQTPGQVALAISKGRRMMADHDVRTALSDLEDLTGTLKVNVYHAMAGRAAANEPSRVLGDINPKDVRSVDLKTLPAEPRKQVADLLEEARYLKDRLRKASSLDVAEPAAGDTRAGEVQKARDISIEQKQRAAEAFQKIDRQVREIVANHLAGEELRVGDKLVARDKVVKEVVAKLGGAVKDAPSSSEGAEGPRFEGAKKLFGRSALSMDAIATNTVGPESDAYKLTIHNVRQAQGDYYTEQRKTHEAFEPALEKAGIPAGSKKLDQWLGKRESVTLPDLGEFKMTRDEMLDVVATASDPQTRKLVDGGVRWTFNRAQREVPIKLTPADLESLRKNLTPGELGLLHTFRARNRELTGPAMAAKRNLSGWAPDATKDYYPRSRNRSQSKEAGLPEGWRGHMDKALENLSSMESRAQDTTMPLSVKGFMARAFDHFDDTAKLIHLAEPVRNAAALWQHPDVTRAIAHHFGESMNQRFEGFLRDTMMVRSAPPAQAIHRLWQRVATNVARAWLQLNPSPMGKNIGGGTISLLPEFESRDFAAGVAKMFSPEVYRKMMAGSGVAWARFHGGLYGQYTPLAGGHSQTVAEMTFGQALKAGKVGQAIDAIPFMEYADSVPLRAAWAASENFIDRTQPGLKDEARTRAVADKFEQALYRTQNGTSSTEASGFASAARGNPMLAAYLMFKSDTAKKYSLLAMMKHADGPTRAKTLAAVAFNALLSGAVGYGIKQGASAIGRAIGGAPVNPDEQKRFAHSALWNTAKDVVGIIPTGSAAVDLVRSQFSKTSTDSLLGNPVLQAGDDFVKGVIDLGKATSAWAQREEGSGKREEAYQKVLGGVWKLAKAGSTLGGLPITPAMFQIENAYRAGTYKEPDAREEAAKAKAQEATAARESLPASVKALTSERDKLQGLGRDQLKPSEKDRLEQLDVFERTYQAKMKDLEAARAKGDQGAVNQVKRELHEAAKGVGQIKVDPRMEAVRDKEEQDRKLRESLPQSVRDLSSEHARLERLPKDQLTREERIRLYRLGDFAEYYKTQLKWIRAARQRGDKAMEDAARQRLDAAAAKVKG